MKDNDFRFEPETHTYFLGNEILPSVSEIIRPLTNYDNVPIERLKNGQEYGTAVHRAIELWLKDDLDETTLDKALKKPLDAFVNWYTSFIEAHGKPVATEQRFYHQKLKYAGTPDLVFEECIVDFKTRKFNKVTDVVQLSAYEKLVSDFPPKNLYVLEIEVEGNIKLVNAKDKHAWGMFRKLLDKYKSDKEIETLIKAWKGQWK